MNTNRSLRDMAPGQTATIRALLSTGSIRRRLLDLGLVENTEVECVGRSPCGDPSAFLIRGAVIAIHEFGVPRIAAASSSVPERKERLWG